MIPSKGTILYLSTGSTRTTYTAVKYDSGTSKTDIPFRAGAIELEMMEPDLN